VGAVVPHACTIRRVLSDLDPAAVEAAMRAWVQAQRVQTPAPDGVPAREQRQVLAVDGKTVRVRHEVACSEWITVEEVPVVVT
jgi:hypothetical protein